ncbi:hypothetical protein ABTZ59_32875 [Streptomyces sp. NPDC094034]|uniref:hypothetical protein n=1 Tax=Streptomyces sp. NPDC094034 TaxID=3155309 RepID=UPI0033215BFC
MRLARVHRARLVVVTAVVGLMAGMVAALSTAQANEESAECRLRHVKVYPGDEMPPSWRYGEVDFQVTVCPDEDASEWGTQAIAITNKTGSAVGYLLESADLKVVASGENKRTRNASYSGSFVVRDCLPYVEWPCARTFKIEVGFALTADKKDGQVRLVYGGAINSTVPSAMTVYRTP